MSLIGYLQERPWIEEWGPPARRLARRLYQRSFGIALLLAAAIHLGAMGAGWGIHRLRESAGQETVAHEVKFVRYQDLAPPPSLEEAPAEPPKFAVAPPRPSLPAAAIPIPVPQEEAEVTTIASQTQMPFATAQGDTGLGTEDLGGVPEGVEGGTGLGIIEEALPAPDDFVPVEEQPVIVEWKTPDYPRLAREAGLEGVVTVRALVDKTGKVRDAIIGKGVNELLDQAALAAAKECVFKPAIQNGNPVAVWVAIPFNFKLQS